VGAQWTGDGPQWRGAVLTTASRLGSTSIARLRAEILAAGAILVRVPVAAEPDRTGSAAFALVGAAIGCVAALALILVGTVAPTAGPIAALAVFALASGGLHLDGLADTADALAAPSIEMAEVARRDPRAGPAGVVAIVLVLTIDWAVLLDVLGGQGLAFAAAAVVIAAAVSRAVGALAPSLATQPFRPGFGQWFAERTTRRDGAVALGTALSVAAVMSVAVGRPVVLIAAVGGFACGIAVVMALGRLRRGLDGDALGAIIELTLAATLLVVAVFA
jgi:adenosylcobinamide-GDP ribazoletransferase